MATIRARLWAPERREQLVDVTARIIAREGVDRVRVPDVAEAAGVTRPVVYRFFPNRQALVSAVLEDFAGELQTRLRARLAEHPLQEPWSGTADDLRHMVRTFVEVVFDTIDDKSAGGWYLLGSAAPYPDLDETMAALKARMVQPWVARVRELTGADASTSETVARMLVAMSRAVVQRWIDGELERAPALDMLMRGTSALLTEFAQAE